ncbi:MAG: hypothetical protein AABY08_04770, partial [Candidatus Thermoplasmatota archaeon]
NLVLTLASSERRRIARAWIGCRVPMCHYYFDGKQNRWVLLDEVEERDEGLEALLVKNVILPPRGEEPKRKPPLLVR